MNADERMDVKATSKHRASQDKTGSTSTKRRVTVPLVAALGAVLTGCGADGGGAGPAAPGAQGGQVRFDRPIDVIVPFGPGGGADQVARAAAQVLEKELGAALPVVNVQGATGSTGITKMVTAAPGSSMAILIQDTLATVPAGAASFELDQIRGVCRLQSMPSALFVKKGSYRNFDDFLKQASGGGDPLKVATVGRQSVDDIVLGAISRAKGVQLRAVPFSAPSERFAALLSGSVDAMYEQLGDVTQYLESGQFEPIVIFSEDKVEGFENVPLATEVGLPADIVLPQFRGLVVRAQTQDNVVARLSEACGNAVKTQQMQDFQKKVYAAEDSYQPADTFDTFLKDQAAAIDKQLQEYNIK